MKKSKAKLAFEMLEKEMDLLLPMEQRQCLGGTNTIWGIDSQGNFYYKQNGEDTWTAFQPLSVSISSSGNSGLNQMYSDYLYWKNQYNSNGYNSNGYNSNGYNSNGYDSNGSSGGGGGGGYSGNGGGGNYTGSGTISPIYQSTSSSGYVGNYFNSSSGGTPGTLSNSLKDVLKNFWNSDLMRALVPDLVSVNVSASLVPGLGSGQALSINFITRGDASVSLTWAGALRAGLHADASVNASVGYFTGNIADASIYSLLGKGYDASIDLEAVGIGGWISPSADPDTLVPTWIGMNVGAGPGAGGSVGASETYLIYVNGKPLIWDL